MNWVLAIDRNREALLRIVAALFAMIGLDEMAKGETVATLPRRARCHVLRILRPAESAVRRLIVIAARDVACPVAGLRSAGWRGPAARPVIRRPEPGTHSVKPAGSARILPFQLIDPLKTFSFGAPKRRAKGFPRICVIGVSDPRPVPVAHIPSPGDPVDATRLCRRLTALKRALDDLPAQARRLARWRARRSVASSRPGRMSPMRPGWPPGHRRRRFHEVDDVLRECHSLARHALSLPDTS